MMLRVAPTEDMRTEIEAPVEEVPVDDPSVEPDLLTGMEGNVKLDQSLVVYMSGEYGPFKCSNCFYWVEPNACQMVAGEIDPEGKCNIYFPPESAAAPEKAEMPAALPEEAPPTAEEGEY